MTFYIPQTIYRHIDTQMDIYMDKPSGETLIKAPSPGVKNLYEIYVKKPHFKNLLFFF